MQSMPMAFPRRQCGVRHRVSENLPSDSESMGQLCRTTSEDGAIPSHHPIPFQLEQILLRTRMRRERHRYTAHLNPRPSPCGRRRPVRVQTTFRHTPTSRVDAADTATIDPSRAFRVSVGGATHPHTSVPAPYLPASPAVSRPDRDRPSTAQYRRHGAGQSRRGKSCCQARSTPRRILS